MVGRSVSPLARSTSHHRQSLFVWNHTRHILDRLLWKRAIGVLLMLYIGCDSLFHTFRMTYIGGIVETCNSISSAMAFS